MITELRLMQPFVLNSVICCKRVGCAFMSIYEVEISEAVRKWRCFVSAFG